MIEKIKRNGTILTIEKYRWANDMAFW